jgi:hypothetical protein
MLNDLESDSEMGKMLPKSLCKASMACGGCAFSKVVGIRRDTVDDFSTWASQRKRRESIVNNSIEEQALPMAINGISELNMKKTIIHVSQEK